MVLISFFVLAGQGEGEEEEGRKKKTTKNRAGRRVHVREGLRGVSDK